MSLNLYTSNRLELLSDSLVKVLSKPLPSPFEPETIIVQSKGMERWISIELAKKMGICSNIRFPFPNKFIYEMFQTVFPDLPQRSFFEREILTWRIMKQLPSILQKPDFDILKSYLEGPRIEIKKIQLSQRIADLFDQYLLFRPEMIFEWESGKDTQWQAAMWRELTVGKDRFHRASVGKDFINFLNKKEVNVQLPSRISLFGISALPKFHIEMLASLANHLEVNLFLLNPCQEYWGDILSDSEIKHLEKKVQPQTLDLFHVVKGNSILASMGKLGRDFFDLIEDINDESFQHFQKPQNHTLLSNIQTDILNLYESSLNDTKPKAKINTDDQSIQIHSCHSPRREMEVLQDHLLRLFEKNPSLKPGDILVIAPDIEPYAPFIHSVFELPGDDPRRIPYNIADRSYSKENPVVKTFFAILDLYNSRFTAPEVFAILESTIVQDKFQISEDDLSLVHFWITETRIRWGKNAENRVKLGLPEFNQNTWRAGLDRLLLGYAMPGENRKLYESLLPFDDVEGSAASVLGKFLEFIEQLFDYVESLSKKRTLQEWNDFLSNLLETFFAVNDDSVADIQKIHRLLGEFVEFQQFSEFDDPIALEPIKHYFMTRLNQEGYGYGFLTGGITFCSLLPMRSIPAKVICLVGMNSDTYPRKSRQLGFDLIARVPQKGDRSRRNDDRYLFLEAILSAREILYISYIGQGIKDNTSIPPSVLISELQDYISANFEMEGIKINDRIKTNHRLQAFSPEYFKNHAKLYSYSKDNMEIAVNLLEQKTEPAPFISQKLPEPDESQKEVSLTDLYRFFRNPVRFLLTKRLNLFLRESSVAMDEKESFSLYGLERYEIAQELVRSDLSLDEIQQNKRSAALAGLLPIGAVGHHEFDRLSNRVQHFVTKTEECVHGDSMESLEINLELSGFKITGKLNHIHENGIFIFRYAQVRAKDHLNAWLHHLVLNSCSQGGYPDTTYLTGVHTASDGQWLGWKFKPLQSSDDILKKLLEIYWAGLAYPVRFFPESSLVYSSSLKNGKTEKMALENARKKWFGSERERGEILNAYFQLCFSREDDPFNNNFDQLSRTVYFPLIDCQEELL